MGAIENKRMWEGVGERFGLVSIKMRRSAGFLPYIVRTTEPSNFEIEDSNDQPEMSCDKKSSDNTQEQKELTLCTNKIQHSHRC
jgi:hypothetical protein